MRNLDAMLKSNEFWGIVALVFLAIGSWKGGAVRAPALILAWLAGSYALYRFWVLNTVEDWRLLALLLPSYAIVLLFVFYWFNPHRPISRAVSGEPIARGTIVAAVSLLNVGASPSNRAIANPPGWVKPTTKMRLVFRDSPLLTNEIKGGITEDLSAFREYLLALGLPVSNEFPPIGVSNGPGSAQTHVAGSLPTYRSSVTITRDWFVDRRAITAQYADYAVNEAFQRRADQHPSISTSQDMMAASISSRYYNWSFWDYKPNEEVGYWSSQLWEMRSSFGKQFTDQLVGFTIKSMLDTPEEGAHPNFDIYFYHKLQQGDSVIDSDPEKMSKITEIIQKSGIDVTTPKAYLDFSATAVKRSDGSFAVSIAVTNESEVPANHGQLRMYFSPDVQLLVEPTRSTKDSLNTLRSSRVIPFDSIPAHASSKLNVEFKPISESFFDTKFFVLDFNYQCETCGNHSESLALKFPLNLFDAKD